MENTGLPKLGYVVAIDGPAGSGKSTVTKELSRRLGFIHVDTGALYRAVAVVLIEQLWSTNLIVDDGESREIAIETARTIHLEFKFDPKQNPSNRIFANGKDVTLLIRTPDVSMLASKISAIPEVRASLLGIQRRLGCEGHSVLEGRDIGTVIFPDADIKFFLSASIEERAGRRMKDLKDGGHKVPEFSDLLMQIKKRDEQDSTRTVAPLKKAHDAIDVDTTVLSFDDVVTLLEKKVRESFDVWKKKQGKV